MQQKSTNGTGETPEERRLRLRALFAEYRTLLVATLLVVAVAGAWLSYGAYGAATETPEEPTADTAWSLSGEFHHAAEVVESTALYPSGTVLEDRPRYYATISPTATGEYAVSYDAPDGRADVDVSVTRIIRAADGRTVFWEDADSVTSTNETAVEPDETVTVDLEVPVADAVDRIEAIESDLGATPGETELLLDVTVSVDGTVAGSRRSTVEHHRITTTFDDGTYAFEDVSFREDHGDRDPSTADSSPGSLRSIGGPVLLLTGIGGLGAGAIVARRFRRPTDAEREWLAYRSEREEYEDVVTTASLPPAVADRPRASVGSLAQLARLAIDLRAALHYDPIEGAYLVVHDELVYQFEPPTPPGKHRHREYHRDGVAATTGEGGDEGIVLENRIGRLDDAEATAPADEVTSRSDAAAANDEGVTVEADREPTEKGEGAIGAASTDSVDGTDDG